MSLYTLRSKLPFASSASLQRAQVRAVRCATPPAYPRCDEHIDFNFDQSRNWPFALGLASAFLAACGEVQPSATAPTDPGADAGHSDATSVVDATTPSEVGPSDAGTDSDPARLDADVASPVDDLGRDGALVVDSRVVPDAPDGGRVNPFTFARSSLPPIPWGKGTPGVIPEEIAVAAILGVFEKRGISMRKDWKFDVSTPGAIAVRLDGFATSGKVGFEYVSTTDEMFSDGGFSTLSDYQSTTGADDPVTLSEREMRLLDAPAPGEPVVAVVNSLDPRFSYPNWLYRTTSEMIPNADQASAVDALVRAVHEFIDYVESR